MIGTQVVKTWLLQPGLAMKPDNRGIAYLGRLHEFWRWPVPHRGLRLDRLLDGSHQDGGGEGLGGHFDAEGAERVVDGIDDRCGRPEGSTFAHALPASLVLGGRLNVAVLEGRDLRRRRQQVVHIGRDRTGGGGPPCVGRPVRQTASPRAECCHARVPNSSSAVAGREIMVTGCLSLLCQSRAGRGPK